MSVSNGKKVGVVGSGLVGKSWAMIFASQGYQVNNNKNAVSIPYAPPSSSSL